MTDPERMAALAEKLRRLSDELYEAGGELMAIGWERHSEQVYSACSLIGIYAAQVAARIEREAKG